MQQQQQQQTNKLTVTRNACRKIATPRLQFLAFGLDFISLESLFAISKETKRESYCRA